jgi:hypothetical protein
MNFYSFSVRAASMGTSSVSESGGEYVARTSSETVSLLPG